MNSERAQVKQVSVVIPAHNCARYVGAAVASVLTDPEISTEVIVVDDGSTDDTALMAARAGARVIRQMQSGAAAARNRGIAESRGTYIAFLDADDLWCDGKLARQMAILDARPEIDLAFGHLIEITAEDSDILMERGVVGRILRGYSPITMLSRASVFRRVGLFDESLSRGEFIDWCSRASDLGVGIELLDSVLAKRRIHSGNTGKLVQPGSSDYAKVAFAALSRRRQHADPQAAVVIFLFNRPAETRALIEALRSVKVKRIFAICDGPRANVLGDEEAVRATREVLQLIDWPCAVSTMESDENVGIRDSYEKGLAWVFSLVDRAIILEDDCIPEPSFFPFCNQLLSKYQDDARIRTISGMSVGNRAAANRDSYVFSKYPLTWGWATWKRAWNLYDNGFDSWIGNDRRSRLSELLVNPQAIDYWSHLFSKNAQTREHWDTNWIHSCWHTGGIAIHPVENLISNIGFGPTATHARNPRSVFSRMSVRTLQLPLTHPNDTNINAIWDSNVEERLFSGPLQNLFRTVREKLHAVGVTVR